MPYEREKTLKKILSDAGYSVPDDAQKCYPERSDVVNSDFASDVTDVYQKLGGVLPAFPQNRLRRSDVQIENVAIELDEENHFNRYRRDTLSANAYSNLNRFPINEYRNYCNEYEKECSTHGRYWTTPSSERQFGASSPNGDLEGNGSSRWKQRAFYDFVKDLSPILLDVRLARISIWDTIEVDGKSVLVDNVLSDVSLKQAAVPAIVLLIQERAGTEFSSTNDEHDHSVRRG